MNPTGAHNYYPKPGAPPILVQIENDWVYSLHFEYTYHRSKFEGVFVPLVEAPAQPAPIDYETPVIVYPATVAQGEV